VTVQGEAHVVAPLDGGEDAALGRLRLARAFALDGDPTEAAGAAAAASRGNADAGALEDGEEAVAAGGLEGGAVVDGDGQGGLRDEAAARGEEAEGHADDQHDDDEVAERDLGHCAAICAKDEKPSDMSPARKKAMPRPRSPSGRSA
jgi:hypothetical protein